MTVERLRRSTLGFPAETAILDRFLTPTVPLQNGRQDLPVAQAREYDRTPRP